MADQNSIDLGWEDAPYLACSLETQSETVVPVCVHGKVVGELEIDSHVAAALGPGDRALCEYAPSSSDDSSSARIASRGQGVYELAGSVRVSTKSRSRP